MPDRKGSRVARTAAVAAGADQASLAQRLGALHVLVELESESEDGATSLLAAVRQAVLVWAKVTVRAASESLALRCCAIGEELRPGQAAVRWDLFARHADQDAVLHIGPSTFADQKVVSVSSTGWVIHMFAAPTVGDAPHGVRLPSGGTQNPVAATGASALGLGELFLRTLGLQRTLVSFDLSLFDYRYGPLGSLDDGPPLPELLTLNGIVVGAGTVGAGFTFALSSVALVGSLAVVDHDAAGPQNFGAHMYVTTETNGISKVDLAAGHLRNDHPDLKVNPKAERLRLFRYRLGRDVPPPDVVVSGLDKARPRQEVQRLWAPLHIDMATKDGLQLQVMVRTVPGSGLCLIRRFPIGEEPSEEQEIATRTGLSIGAVADELADISEEDVAHAPEVRRAELAAARARGERRCNVITRGDLLDGGDGGEYVGSAPFTALFAGVVAAAELMKSRALGLDRDGTYVLWHVVTRNLFVERTRCAAECECASVSGQLGTSVG